MKTKMPIGLRKQITFVENALQWDSDTRDSRYKETISQMETSEEITNQMKMKRSNLEDELKEFCFEISREVQDFAGDKGSMAEDCINRGLSDKEVREYFKKLARGVTQYYQEIGQKMYDFGIIDILVDRSNKTFTKEGFPFLKTTTKKAMEEFDPKKNYRTSYYVMYMKLVWTINKIVKFVDTIEYGDLYYKDSFGLKTNNSRRGMLISKLKTDYLKKVLEAKKCMTDEEIAEFTEAEEEYKKLFENEFHNLDFEKDLEEVAKYEEMKEMIYDDKGLMVAQIIGLAFQDPRRKYYNPEIKDCGIGEDERGSLFLGMNLQGYPTQVTVHFAKSIIPIMKEAESIMQEEVSGAIFTQYPPVEVFKTLRKSNGEIFPTNLLFVPDERQRQSIIRAYRENPENPILKHFYSQITSKEPQNKNIKYVDIRTLE